MSAESEREVEIFQTAIRLPTRDRGTYLDRACESAAELRTHVERLVEAHDSVATAYTASATQAAWFGSLDDEDDGDPLLGKTIGSFTVRRVLGEGGMGVVYEAEQTRPARTVALKIVRPFLVTRDLIRRFEHEAEALGRLQHPGIAQIFEVGSFESNGVSRPFFAMEMIEGTTLLEHVQRSGCSTTERLQLLAQVADAVEHAHDRGVIHRDLKPQNILVDASGHPKVLDFGIARMTESDIRTTTLQTKTGQIVGTIPYMSPEQVRGSSNELDARTDVYALGVIGFELLTGRLPINVANKSIAEAARMILYEDPERLSAENRTYRGDMETIIAKALEKDRARRYATAADFAADLRAYLGSQPIQARPASSWYQLRKFAGRNRGLVAGVLLAFASLVVGLVVSLDLLRSAERERQNTLRALKEAERQTEIAQTTVKFLTKDLLTNANPYATAGEAPTLRMLVDRAAATVEERLADRPLVEAAVRQTLGFVYNGLGDYREAVVHLKRALELAPDDSVPLPFQRSNVVLTLGNAFLEQRLTTDGIKLLSQALDEAKGEAHPDTANVGGFAMLLGYAHECAGLFARAAELYEEAEPLLVAAHGADSVTVLNLREYAASLALRDGIDDSTVEKTRTIFTARQRIQGLKHPMTLRSLANLVSALISFGALDEAAEFNGQLRTLATDVFGEHHLLVAKSHHFEGQILDRRGNPLEATASYSLAHEIALKARNPEFASNALGSMASAQGRLSNLDEALRIAEEAHRLAVEAFGERHLTTISRSIGVARFTKDPEAKLDILVAAEKLGSELAPDSETTEIARNDLGMAHLKAKRFEEAEVFVRAALASCRKRYGDQHPNVARAMENLANIRLQRGFPEETKTMLAEVLKTRMAVLPEGHPAIGRTMHNLANVARKTGDLETAATWGAKSLALSRAALGETHSDVLFIAEHHGKVLQQLHRFEELRPVAMAALTAARVRKAEQSIATFSRLLGVALMGLGHDQEAEEFLVEQWELQERLSTKDALELGHAAYELARCLMALDEDEEAIERFEQADRIYTNTPDVDASLRIEAQTALVTLCTRAGRTDEAAKWQEKLDKLPR